MKFKLNPALVIYILGLTGLLFTFVDGSGEIGSKIPLSLFFIVVIILGIIIQMTPKDQLEGEYGEHHNARRSFG